MYTILKKEALNPTVTRMDIAAPLIARKAEPGQFVILRVDEAGERIPLTVADTDPEAGSVTIIFQIVGATTYKLNQLQVGDSLHDFVGPLGVASHVEGLKKVAVIGGGPAGLTAAYYLQLKGYHVTVFEKHKRLGGMLRYGIPSYRLPDDDLDRDINAILSTGIQVKLDVDIGREITFDQIRSEYDSVYIAIGAQIVNRMNIPGQDSEGVLSAVELLGAVGAGEAPDFTGKNVVVVGGGNVAMDATRTAKRLGAASVTCVYRRRIEDMTAAREEIDGAIAEGCEIMPMLSPVRIETEDDRAVGIAVQPQLSGPIENGRPKPINADQPEIILPADVVITAIGQAIDSAHFESSGVGTERRRIKADPSGAVPGMPGVFTGGDCFFGPSTVVRAIDSGKVVAGNIDHYFGFHTPITSGVDIPPAQTIGKPAWGRVNMRERTAGDRKEDFNLMEACLTDEEAAQECSRCLRCDHYGYGAFRGGRKDRW